MPVARVAPDPLHTLAAGLGRQRLALDDAAARIAEQGPDVDAIVDLDVAETSAAAIAAAMRSVAETERGVIDLLA